MPTTSPEPNDDDLSRLLASWKISPGPDPHFRPAVWKGVRRDSPPSWAAYLRRHGTAWSITLALAMGLAGWVGRSAAEAKLESRRDQMVVSYLGEIDPRVMTHLSR